MASYTIELGTVCRLLHAGPSDNWAAAWDAALRGTTGPLCVVLKDIYKCPANARLWRQLRQEATVSIDMMWYGLLFWNEKLQKGKYNLII